VSPWEWEGRRGGEWGKGEKGIGGKGKERNGRAGGKGNGEKGKKGEEREKGKGGKDFALVKIKSWVRPWKTHIPTFAFGRLKKSCYCIE